MLTYESLPVRLSSCSDEDTSTSNDEVGYYPGSLLHTACEKPLRLASRQERADFQRAMHDGDPPCCQAGTTTVLRNVSALCPMMASCPADAAAVPPQRCRPPLLVP